MYSCSAWSRRSWSTGDGRPLYWAAPSTMMRVGRAGAVVVAGPVHLHERDGDVGREQRDDDQHQAQEPARPAPRRQSADDAGSVSRLIDAGPRRSAPSLTDAPSRPRRRSSVRAWPSASSDSNSGGPTDRPVVATRTGPCALLELRLALGVDEARSDRGAPRSRCGSPSAAHGSSGCEPAIDASSISGRPCP